MDSLMISIGDVVTDSPMGAGTVTGFNPDGYPEVDGQAVSYLTRADGAKFGSSGTLQTPTRQSVKVEAPVKTELPPMSSMGGRTTVKVERGFTIKQ